MGMELGYLGSVQTTTVGAICQVLLYCTLACNARVVGLTQRHPIGQELLQVLSGRNISDAARHARIESSIIRIPAPKAPKEWDSLSTAVRSKGKSALAASLTRQTFIVPDVENATEHKCGLVLCPNPNRFREEAIDDFVVSLFKTIACCDKLPTSKADSTMPYEPLEMDFRNFVWYKDNLAALDTTEGTILGQELLFPGTELFHTVFEEELGVAAVDIFYFDSLDVADPEKLFVCKRFSSKGQLFAV